MSVATAPEPETGWRPDTPAGDTLLRRSVLALSSSWLSASSAEAGRSIHDDRFVATDLGRPSGLFNSAALLQPLHGRQLTDALDDIERFYATTGSGAVMLWSPWPTPDLHDRGWQLEGHPPLLVRGPQPALNHHGPDEFEITEVDDRDGLEQWCALAVDGYPFKELQPYRPGSLLDARILDDDRWRFQLGCADGRPVCLGAQYVDHGLNLLVLGVTAPDVRGRGYYRAMATHRLSRRPDLPAAAVVSDHSRPVLVDRLGFLPLTRLTLWTRPRPRPSRTGETP